MFTPAWTFRVLTGAAKPSVVVTAADLDRINTRVPEFYTGDLFCPVGRTPLYLGQPAALLIFETFDAFDQARLLLRDAPVLKFGAETGAVVMPPYGAFRFTRVAGPTPDAPDVYSPVKAGWVSPGRFHNDDRPVWEPLPIPTGQDYKRRRNLWREDPRRAGSETTRACWCWTASSRPNPSTRCSSNRKAVLPGTTQSRKNLEIVLGVQSPYEAATAVAFLLGEARDGFKPAHIQTHFAYFGGGFGGRDHTPFPLYVALAAMFFPGRPVRLALDRYQQFQSGIKRHAFKMRTRIGVDRVDRQDHSLRRRPRAGRRRPRQFLAQCGDGFRHRCDRHLRHSESRYHHGRDCTRAA